MRLWNFKIKFLYTTIPWGSTVMEAGQQSSSCRIPYDAERWLHSEHSWDPGGLWRAHANRNESKAKQRKPHKAEN